VPLSAIGPDKTGPSSLPNRVSYFYSYEQELSTPYLICVPTYFGDPAGESITSSMKKGDPSANGSDLNKNNIINPTLDHLSEEDGKALEAYHKKVDDIFLLHYKVTRHGSVQRDATPINICKSEVTPEVRPNPSLSLDDVQIMINSALERQTKSGNEMMRRLIEERDGKKFVDHDVHASSS
jgi:hypothetical protein